MTLSTVSPAMPQYPVALDGDTFIMPDGRRMRLSDGVDAPEVAHRQDGTRPEAGAALARAYAQAYAQQPGVLDTRNGQLDAHQRDLGTLQAPGQLPLGQALVARGLGVPTRDDTSGAGAQLNHMKRMGLAPLDPGEAEQRALVAAERRLARPNGALAPRQTDDRLFSASVARGVDSMQAALGGAAMWLGEVSGIDSLRDFGADVATENQAQAQLNPAKYSGLDGLKQNPLGYLTELAGEQVPTIAALASGAGVGAGAARLTAERVAARAATEAMADAVKLSAMRAGATAGAASVSFPQHLGEAKNALVDAGVEDNSGVLTTAAANTALDMASLLAGAAPIARSIGMTQRAAAITLDQVPGHVLRSIAAEGGTEGLQEFTKQLLVQSHTGQAIDYGHIRDAALAGGIVGGALSGAGTTAAALAGQEQQQQPDAPAQTVAEPIEAALAQAQAVADGTKPAAFFTTETAEGLQLPPELTATPVTDGAEAGVLVDADGGATGQAVAARIQQGEPLQAAAGAALGYTKTKDQLDPATTTAVVGRDAAGRPVHEELADAESLSAAARTAASVAGPTGSVSVAAPEQVLAERVASRDAQGGLADALGLAPAPEPVQQTVARPDFSFVEHFAPVLGPATRKEDRITAQKARMQELQAASQGGFGRPDGEAPPGLTDLLQGELDTAEAALRTVVQEIARTKQAVAALPAARGNAEHNKLRHYLQELEQKHLPAAKAAHTVWMRELHRAQAQEVHDAGRHADTAGMLRQKAEDLRIARAALRAEQAEARADGREPSALVVAEFRKALAAYEAVSKAIDQATTQPVARDADGRRERWAGEEGGDAEHAKDTTDDDAFRTRLQDSDLDSAEHGRAGRRYSARAGRAHERAAARYHALRARGMQLADRRGELQQLLDAPNTPAEIAELAAAELDQLDAVLAQHREELRRATKRARDTRAARDAARDAELDDVAVAAVELEQETAPRGALLRVVNADQERGSGLSRERAEDFTRAAVRRLRGAGAAPRWKVVGTTKELPEKLLQSLADPKARAGEVRAKGAYYEGILYVVADMHRTADDVAATVAHEFLGHKGLEAYLDARAAALGGSYSRAVMELNSALGGVDGMRELLPRRQRAEFERDVAVAAQLGTGRAKAGYLVNEFVALTQELRGDESLPRAVYRKVMEYVGFVRQKVWPLVGMPPADRMGKADLYRFLASVEAYAVGNDGAARVQARGAYLSRDRDPADAMDGDRDRDPVDDMVAPRDPGDVSYDPDTAQVLPSIPAANTVMTGAQAGKLQRVAATLATGVGVASDWAGAALAPMRSSIAQIARYHKGLARQVERAAKMVRDDRRILQGRWAKVAAMAEHRDKQAGVSQLDRRRKGSPALTEAFDQLLAGRPTSPVAKAMREFLDFAGGYANSREFGKIRLREDYVPQVHDIDKIRQDPEGFEQFLTAGNAGRPFEFTTDQGKVVPFDAPAARAFVSRLLDPHATDSETLELRGTSLPYAGSLKQRTLTDPAFQRAAAAAGWAYSDPQLVVEYYIDSVVKEVAWSKAMGAMRGPDDGAPGFSAESVIARWLPQMGFPATQAGLQEAINAKWVMPVVGLDRRQTLYKVYVRDAAVQRARAVINNQHGRHAATRTDRILDGVMGNLGADMDPKLRRAQQWLLLLQTTTTLMFSTVSSIPELGIAIGKSINEAGFKATAQGVGRIVRGASRREAVELARALGVAGQSLSNIPLLDSSVYRDMQGLPRVLLDGYFKLNLNHYWTEAMRVMTTTIAVEAFRQKLPLAEAGDPAAVEFFRSLGTSVPAVRAFLDGGLQTPSFSTDGAFNLHEDSAARALYSFIDGKVVMPDSADMPVWMNDPRFALVAQLKRFFYAYGRVVALPLLTDMQRRYEKARASGDNAAIAAVQASFPLVTVGALAIPLAALAQQIKEDLKGQDDEPQWAADNFMSLVSQTGIFGPVDLAMSFAVAEANGQDGFTRALGPFAGHLSTLLQYGVFSPEFIQRSTPVLGQLPAAREFWDGWKYETSGDDVEY